MVTLDPTQLHALVARLVEARVADSLGDVERALTAWRAGQLGALEAHGVVLKHAARCERLVERVTAVASDRPQAVLRDAFDVGAIDRETFTALAGVPPDAVEPAGSLSDDEAAASDKRGMVESLLEQGAILVHIDARGDDVVVPNRLRGDAKLVLRFGYALTPAIVDLAVDERGISGTLTFGGQPFHCTLPWRSIYAAIVEGADKGMVWPEDIPEVVLAGQRAEAVPPPVAVKDPTPEPAPAPRPRGGHLKLVD